MGVDAWLQKKENLGTDVLKIALTNTAPVATNAVLTDITEISATNGYVAGGNTVASTSLNTATAGTDKLIGNAVVFTASGGSMAAFRYLVLYDSTATNKDLLGWYDYGSALTLAVGDSLTIGKDTAGGNWDTTTPILTLA